MSLEKTADPSDMATQIQDRNNEQAWLRMRKSLAPQTHPDFDGAHCLDCADDMPPERLAAQRIRCTLCESKIEKRNKQRG